MREIVSKFDLVETGGSNNTCVEVAPRVARAPQRPLKTPTVPLHGKCPVRPDGTHCHNTISDMQKCVNGKNTCRKPFGQVLIVESMVFEVKEVRLGLLRSSVNNDVLFISLDPGYKALSDLMYLLG